MATKKKSTKKNVNKALVAGAAVVGAAAAAAGYYFYGPKGKQHRAKMRSWTLKAQGEIMERVEKLKEIDKETYNKVVDEVTKKYAKAKGVAAKEIASFAKDVKSQWKHVEKEFDKGVTKGKKATKTTTKKKAKK